MSDHLISNIRIILSALITVIAGVVIFLFLQYRFTGQVEKQPPSPTDSTAILTLDGFHHVATRNGKTEWTLDADSAKLYAGDAILKGMSGRFPVGKKKDAVFKGETGQVDMKTLDFSVVGDVSITYEGMVLNTRDLLYRHDSHMIVLDSPVKVNGDGATLSADSAKLMPDSGRVVFIGHVQGFLKDGFGFKSD